MSRGFVKRALNPPQNGNTRTVLDKRVNLPDGDDVCQHVAEPLRIHKIEVVQERVLKMKHGAVVMEKTHGLLQFPVSGALGDQGAWVSEDLVPGTKTLEE